MGDGVTDDTGAIAAAVAAAGVGDTVVFPFTGRSYAVSETIVVPSGVTLRSDARGPGYGSVGYTNAGIVPTLIALPGSNLDAVVASAAWYHNLGGIDGYITIEDMLIDANRAHQTGGLGHGIALAAWRSHVRRCTVDVTGATTAFGIVVGTRTRNGSTAAGNAIECHIAENTTYGGLNGIGSQGVNFTDSWIRDNVLIASANGINLTDNAGAGCVISGNHVYYHTANGILSAGFETSITENYLEPVQAGAGTGNLAQIKVLILGDGVIVSHNRVMLATAPVTGVTFWGVFLQWIASATAVCCAGNTITGGSSGADRLSWAYADDGLTCSLLLGNASHPENGAEIFHNGADSVIAVTQPAPVVASGTAVLAAGTVTVSDPKVTAHTTVRVQHRTLSGTVGALFVSATTAGTSFTIQSTSATDTSTVHYEIVSY